jgi:hypothetical protein
MGHSNESLLVYLDADLEQLGSKYYCWSGFRVTKSSADLQEVVVCPPVGVVNILAFLLGFWNRKPGEDFLMKEVSRYPTSIYN